MYILLLLYTYIIYYYYIYTHSIYIYTHSILTSNKLRYWALSFTTFCRSSKRLECLGEACVLLGLLGSACPWASARLRAPVQPGIPSLKFWSPNFWACKNHWKMRDTKSQNGTKMRLPNSPDLHQKHRKAMKMNVLQLDKRKSCFSKVLAIIQNTKKRVDIRRTATWGFAYNASCLLSAFCDQCFTARSYIIMY
jgi:hypothetical protein